MAIKKLEIIYLKKNIPIIIHINSPGGTVFSAFATVDTIINCRVKIITIIEGVASSAASLISIVADKRYITKNSFIMIHELSDSINGKFKTIKEEFLNDKLLLRTMKNIYLKNTKLKKNDLDIDIANKLYWTADTALEKGFVDKIIDEHTSLEIF
jgi:ATP-dependent Clp protease, protease subunit